MPTTLNSKLTSAIQSFVAELSTLVRTAALDSVQSALSGGGRSAGSSGSGGNTATSSGNEPARLGPGRPKGSGVRRGPGRPKGSGKSTGASGAITAKLLQYVTLHDGRRLEEISRALNIPTADLKRPAQTLLAANAVRTTGAKRGTKYHVAGSASRGGRGGATKKGG